MNSSAKIKMFSILSFFLYLCLRKQIRRKNSNIWRLKMYLGLKLLNLVPQSKDLNLIPYIYKNYINLALTFRKKMANSELFIVVWNFKKWVFLNLIKYFLNYDAERLFFMFYKYILKFTKSKWVRFL